MSIGLSPSPEEACACEIPYRSNDFVPERACDLRSGTSDNVLR